MSVVTGCGRGPTHPTVHLAGDVSIEGRPVVDGKLVFLPGESSRGPAVGVTITGGKYDCPHAPTGKLTVQIHALRETGKQIRTMGKEIPELVSIVPPQNRAGIAIEVAADNLSLDFSLKHGK